MKLMHHIRVLIILVALSFGVVSLVDSEEPTTVQEEQASKMLTLEQLCTPEQAELFFSRAIRIADSFRFGIAMAQGRIAEPLDRRAPR